MSNTNDPGKDKARPVDASQSGGQSGSQPKKPYATLDLKATEVASKEPAKDVAKETTVPATGATSGTGKTDWSKVTSTATDAGKPGEARKEPAVATGTSSGAKSAEPPKTATPAAASTQRADDRKGTAGAAATVAAAQPARRGGFGSFISHLAAGIVGGLIGMLGADQLAQTFGVADLVQSPTAALQSRIAALETQGRGGAPSADIARKLTDSEARLAKLEEAARALPQIVDASRKLAADTRSLEERVGQGGTGGTAQRVAKLEETLATLAAAGQNANAGPLPQLAALTSRIRELEQTIGTQTTSLRRDLTQSLETRTQQAAEAGEVARAATQRIDRDLSAVKTESATITQRVEALKADGDRTAQTLRVVQEETGGIRSALDGLKGDLDSRLKSVARPNDVTAALTPLTGKIAEIEQGLQGVVRSEADRRSNAERIVLSLELANLKRVLDRGQPFDTELGEVKKAAGGKIDLGALERYKAQGVLTVVELARDFRPAGKAILDADMEPVDGTVVDRLLAGAKSIVRVRKVEHATGDRSAEAIVARMEAALKDGRLAQVLDEAKALAPRAQDAAKGWLGKVEARHSVDRALAAVEGQLKSSLGGGKAQN